MCCLPAWDLTTVIIIFSKNTVREKHSGNSPLESGCQRPQIQNWLPRPHPKARTLNTHLQGNISQPTLPSSNQPVLPFFFFFFFVILGNWLVLRWRRWVPLRAAFMETPTGPLSEIMPWDQNQPTSPNAISWVCFCRSFSPWLSPKDPHFFCLLTASFPCFSFELLLNPTGLSPWILQSWSLAGLTSLPSKILAI